MPHVTEERKNLNFEAVNWRTASERLVVGLRTKFLLHKYLLDEVFAVGAEVKRSRLFDFEISDVSAFILSQ